MTWHLVHLFHLTKISLHTLLYRKMRPFSCLSLRDQNVSSGMIWFILSNTFKFLAIVMYWNRSQLDLCQQFLLFTGLHTHILSQSIQKRTRKVSQRVDMSSFGVMCLSLPLPFRSVQFCCIETRTAADNTNGTLWCCTDTVSTRLIKWYECVF